MTVLLLSGHCNYFFSRIGNTRRHSGHRDVACNVSICGTGDLFGLSQAKLWVEIAIITTIRTICFICI